MARSNKKKAKSLTDGLVYDRIAYTWVTPEVMEQRTMLREELAFQRRRNQGELAAPMIIRDGQGGIHGLQSMADGKMYDSKRAMRQHYRDAGMTEIGDDHAYTPEGIASTYAPNKRPKTQAEKDAISASVKHDIEWAHSQVNLTAYRHEEI